MKKMTRALSFALVLSLLVGILPFYTFLPTTASAEEYDANLISKENKEMRLWYNSPAPDDDNRMWTHNNTEYSKYSGWEALALPIGNAYMGAKVFGITERERIQLNENSLSTSGGTQTSGMTNFSETYLHFNHDYSAVSDYERDLILNNSTSHVRYTYNGVVYEREYFASYPDKVLVIKLSANVAGNLSFTLEPKISYYEFEGRSGDVIPSVVTTDGSLSIGSLTLEGNLPGSNKSSTEAGYQEGTGTIGYDMDFEAQYRVFATGGTMTTSYNSEGGTVDSVDEYANGTITVSGADSAYIIIALGTNYELDPSVFLEPNNSKKLDGFAHPHEKVSTVIEAASEKSFDELRAAHIADYTELFARVALNLTDEIPSIPTNQLLAEYKNGNHNAYLEELMFAYGRYLLISSSRSGTLPPNLQGVWNRYHGAMCLDGYWGNVNIQMNFWSAFNTDLAECFESYVEYYDAYIAANTKNATNSLIKQGAISSASEVQGTLWSLETGFTPFAAPAGNGGRDGWGNTPFMAETFWDYYDYTRDENILNDVTLPALIASANFLSMLLKYDEETGYYLTPNSGSPEQSTTSPYISYVNNNPGYVPKGTTYDQALTYSNYIHVLEALEYVDESTLSDSDRAVIARIREQVDHLDPIPIGLSGQVKEFREEQYYGEIGETNHRHISHLTSIYPANVINASTPAWMDAAEVSLNGRGDSFVWGWSNVTHILSRARTGDGNAAYNMLNNEINANVAENLCTLGVGSFQIEANLGTPSAIAEMLLQSHNGYIEPLAALPDAWDSGSYSGLVARGNFSVGAAWENGLAQVVTIESRNGGTVSVYYPGIASANVKTESGKKVNFTVQSKDLISFDTTKGETYVITGFTAVEEMNSPETLGYSISSNGTFNFACDTVTDAIGYKLYTAIESAAAYTLVGTSSDGKFTYAPDNINKRMTFAVTAVNADGTESDRTLAYFVPADTSAGIEDVVGSVLESGELQVTVKSSGSVSEYRLYSKAQSDNEYTLISSDKYPIILGGMYSQSTNYYVSVVNAVTGVESGKLIVSRFGASTAIDYNAANIFLGKTFVAGDLATKTHSGVHSGVTVNYDYTKLTDSNTHYQTGRFSTYSSDSSQVFDGIIDLGNGYILNELLVNDFNSTVSTAPFMGTGLEISVYSMGNWKTVVSCSSNEEIVAYRKDATNLSFNLGGVRAEKVRIYIPARLNTNSISINEIQCSGILDTNEYDYSDNFLLGKTFVPTTSAAAEVHPDANYDYGYNVITDGSYAAKGGRFSTKSSSSSQHVDATVELGGMYVLGELRIYDFNAHAEPNASSPTYLGPSLTVEAYANGAWSTAIYCEQSEMGSHRVSPSNAWGAQYLSFDLTGIKAERLRVYIPSNISGSSISFYEITCSGYKTSDSSSTVGAFGNVLVGKTFTPGPLATATHDGESYGYGKLTDGGFVYNKHRFSTITSDPVQRFDGYVVFDGKYKLDKLRLFDFNGHAEPNKSNPTYAGTDLLVEVLIDGVWVKVWECTQAEYASHREGNGYSDGTYLAFDMEGIVAEGIHVYNSSRYGTSSISYNEIQLMGYSYTDGAIYSNENILNGLTNVSANASSVSGYPLSNIFDGTTSTYAKVDGQSYTLTLSFDEVKVIKHLRIFENIGEDNLVDGVLSTASNETKVEVYIDGVWLVVCENFSLNSGKYTDVEMYGVECSKVRITFNNTRLFDGESIYRTAQIAEIAAYTTSSPVDRSQLLELYKQLDALENADVFGFDEIKAIKLDALAELLMDTSADQDAVDAYSTQVSAVIDKLSTDTPEVDLVTDAYGDFSSYNLKLSGDIGINFYADLADDILDKYPNAFVIVEYVKYSNKASAVVKEKHMLKDIPIDDLGRYILMLTLPAAQMTDDIRLRLVLDGFNIGELKKTSIREYADVIIANEEGIYTDEDINLVKAMLNYGGLAQVYFNYRTDNLANDGIDVSHLVNTANDGRFSNVGDLLNGFTPAGWSLVLESNVKIRLYAEISNPDDYFVTAQRGANEDKFILTLVHLGGNDYMIEIDLMDAKYIDDVFIVTVEELSSGKAMEVYVNATRYLDKMTNGGTSDVNLIALCDAIKLYCSMANGYN